MNHIYKTVWNAAMGTWTAVQETAKSHGKSSSSKTGRAGEQTVGVRFAFTLVASALLLASGQVMAVTGTESVGKQVCFYDATSQSVICGDATTQTDDMPGGKTAKSVVIGQGASNAGESNVAVGIRSASAETASVAIGSEAKALHNQSVAIGQNAEAHADWDISIGRFAGQGTKNPEAEGRNIAIGDGALRNATNPNNNVALGTSAAAGSAGDFNVVIGTYANSTTAQASGVTANRVVAIGDRALATADSAIAIGNRVKASGSIATAVGASADAKGAYSIANGYAATAEGISSIAIGAAQNLPNKTQATKNYAIALGSVGTQATGEAAIAIGTEAKASNRDATAIGKAANAAGQDGVAIGLNANAAGQGVVAMGTRAGTAALPGNLPAGAAVVAPTDAVFIGSSAGHGSNNNRMQISIGNNAGKDVGNKSTVATTENIAIGNTAGSGVNGNTNVAISSRAGQNVEGHDNFAALLEAGQNVKGVNNIAIGKQAGRSADPAAPLEVSNTIAMGLTAQGTHNDTIALGRNAKAQIEDSIAIGRGVTTELLRGDAVGSREGMIAIGSERTKASGKAAVAIGRNSQGIGRGTVALGDDAQSTTGQAIAVGAGVRSGGAGSVAIGSASASNADRAVSLGVESSSTAFRSVALGAQSEAARAALTPNAATSNVATAAGNQVYALDQATQTDKDAISATVKGNLGAVSVGNATNTRQIINVAAGSEDSDAVNVAQLKAVANQINQAAGTHYYSVKDQAGDSTSAGSNYNNDGATGDRSLAAGIHSQATGTNATAVGGKHAKATAVQALALGADTSASGNSSIAIGGDDLDHLKPDSVRYYNTLTGDTINVGQYQDTTASADAAIAVGVQTQATGDLSTAVGVKSEASGLASVALGVGSKGQAEGGVALGAGAAVQPAANAAVALGAKAGASANAAMALGTLAQADKDWAVALGAGSATANNATQETTASVGGITYSGFAGAGNVAAGHQISVGRAGLERQIKNVAPGAINANSTDAINGSQLHATQAVIGNLASSTARNFGGGAAVQPDGSISAPTYTINGTAYNDVGSALQAAANAGGGAGAGTHYYSVKSTDTNPNSNFNNDGAKAIDSVAAGVRVEALRTNGVAIGVDVAAAGEESLAIGNNVIAGALLPKANPNESDKVDPAVNVKGATAVGNNSRATAVGAQAFGQSSKATALNAAAIGRLATASGERASAFGVGNTASGASSFAGGDRSVASGVNSTAIGLNAKAQGGNSIAVGNNATATTTETIAIGRDTQATKTGAIAMGQTSVSTGISSTAVGLETQATGNQSAAFGATAAATADQAMAIGYHTAASAQYSTALGNTANASGIHASALGSGATAIGGNSIAVGSGTATGGSSIAVGRVSKSYTGNDIAIGSESEAGVNGGASSSNSIAVGLRAKSPAVSSVAVGVNTSAAVNDSVAVGNGAKTTGAGSGAVAIGRNANADGQGSTSMGINARSANQSIAIGTNANNPFGTAGTIGNSSVAIGNNTNAAGENTVALGNQSTATGSKATALGFDTKAQGQSSVVIGDSARNERNTGNASQPHADQVVAVGVSSNVNSLGGIAIGSTTKTTGVYGTAIGIGSQNNADFGVALGALSTTDSNIVVNRDGYDPLNPAAPADAAILATKANAAGVSVGGRVLSTQGSAPGQTAVRPNGVSDGDIIRRQIHNVAAGTDDTDAVNVAQLKAVANKTATTPLTVTDGKVTAPAAGSPDADKLATAGDIANAINNSGFTLTAQGEPSTASLVNPGETVDLRNSDGNIAINKDSAASNTVTFDLAPTVTIGPDVAAGGKPITIDGTAGTISGLSGTLPATTSAAPTPTTAQAAPALTPAQSTNAATVGDVLNAGWNLQGNGAAKDFVRAYDTVNFVNGNGTTVTVDSDGATSTIKVDVNAQGLAESAQLPVVYTKADGTKVYKHSDGNFYDAPNGGGTQVPVGDIIASMQNADGTTATPTTLANVKAGTKDTDAVNVSQLKGAAAALGGGAGIDPNTGAFTAPSYVINKTDGSSYPVANNVGEALQNLNAEVVKPLTFAGDSGANVQRTLGSTVNVKGGATGTLTDGNIGVEANGTDTLTVKLAENINLGNNGSVQTGNTIVNNDGVKITGGANGPVSLTNAGLNNGGNKITNVANGTDPNDAVNFSQLQALSNAAKTHYYSVNDAGVQGGNYDNDGATGGNALAAGVGAQATGTSSTAVGHDAKATNSAAVAIGWQAEASGDHSIALGGASQGATGDLKTMAKGNSSMAIGFGTEVKEGADWSLAFGDLAKVGANAERSVAIGVQSAVEDGVTGAVALGHGARVAHKDSVALGSGSVADAVDNTGRNTATVGGITYSGFAADAPTSMVSVGTQGAERTITHVAAGRINANSTDAINGSQLHATQTVIGNVANTTVAALGGTSAIDPATGNITAGLDVGGNTYNNVQDALRAINTTASGGWNLRANAGPISNIAGPNNTVNVIDGSNTKVTLNGTDLKVDVVDNPTFSGPVTANGGLTVGGNLTAAAGTNVDMGNNIIHNVADGVADTDAVNVRQMRAMSGNITNITNQINAVDARVTQVDNRVTNLSNRVDGIDGKIKDADKRVTDVANLVGENLTNPDGTKGLTVYDVAGQTRTDHTNVISALNQVKNEGTKYSHTRDNGEAPIIGPTNDSSAGALGSTAQGVNAIVEEDAVNATAMGRRARVRRGAAGAVAVGNEATAGAASAVALGDASQALGERSVAIGKNNVVHTRMAGAMGDSNTVNVGAGNSYAVGNNNTVNTADTFVMGNNVVTNVANSVYLGAGAAATAAPTAQTAGMATYNASVVDGVTHHYAGGTPAGVVSVGDVGQERRVQNVAAGLVSPTSTDAINGSQLYQTNAAIGGLNNRINANHDKAMGGIASAMASAGLPQAYLPGKSMIAMGVGAYQGRSAVAVGVSTISDNGRWIIKGSVNANNKGNVGATLGAGYQW